MAQAPQRVVALILAVLFLVSSVAFSLIVLLQLNDNDEPNIPDQSQQTAAENVPQPACEFTLPAGAAKAVPEVYVSPTDVTELQVNDLQVGNGQEIAAGDCLQVKYHGTLADSGEVFDGNFDQDTLLQFPVGQGAVIPGWDSGLVGMKVGGVRRLVIPSDLAYGASGSGSIPPNADLVFVVELVSIKE